MVPPQLAELYAVLMAAKFNFMRPGVHHLQAVLQEVKARFPQLRDDSVLCVQICTYGTERPEWEHRVRAALQNLKASSGSVVKDPRHGYWLFRPSELPGAAEVTETAEEYREGREFLRLHRRKERNRIAVRRKKESVRAVNGKLLCEVCDFDFPEVYGVLGTGFAECHHRVPLGQLTAEHRLRLSELAIVCANCHRMLHRQPLHTVEELREVVLKRRGLMGVPDRTL